LIGLYFELFSDLLTRKGNVLDLTGTEVWWISPSFCKHCSS